MTVMLIISLFFILLLLTTTLFHGVPGDNVCRISHMLEDWFKEVTSRPLNKPPCVDTFKPFHITKLVISHVFTSSSEKCKK